MATPSLSQSSLFQPKPSLLNPNTLQNQNANSHLFGHHNHNHLSITLPLKTRNGLFSNPKASLTVQSNVNSTAPIKKCDCPIIVIDNYDSFTYNLCQYMGEVGCYFEVYRNDEITVDELKRMNPRGILISPGPGKVVRSPSGVMHGKSSLVYYDEKQEDNLFAGLSNPFTAGRYHSLVIEKENFPGDELKIAAWTEDGLLMAAHHKKYKHLQGVQFHPESIISTEGKTTVLNFVKQKERREAESRIEG